MIYEAAKTLSVTVSIDAIRHFLLGLHNLSFSVIYDVASGVVPGSEVFPVRGFP